MFRKTEALVSCVRLVTLLGVFAACPASRAGEIDVEFVDTVPSFVLVVAGGPIEAVDAHTVLGGVNWFQFVRILEINNLVVGEGEPLTDVVEINGASDHLAGPHGEPPNPNFFTYAFVASGGVGEGIHSLGPVIGVVPHPPTGHLNTFVATMTYAVDLDLGDLLDDADDVLNITRYVLVVCGKHPEWNKGRRYGGPILSVQGVPPGASQTFGAVSMVVEDEIGSFSLGIAVSGIDLPEIRGAEIRLGSPDENGPIILPLGGAESWTDLAGLGIARTIDDDLFPTAFLPALLAGETYVNVRTWAHPAGEIRGQLLPATGAAGNVNARVGPIADVLTVNGSPGDSERVVAVTLGSPIELELRAAPMGPDLASYGLWAWWGRASNPRSIFTADGFNPGCTVNPTPFDPTAFPQPFRCLRGGLGPEYCGSARRFRAPAAAPWTIRAQGFLRPIELTVQGVLQDASTGDASGLAVTNAVTLSVR